MVDFKLARRHIYYVCTINTSITIAVTNDAKGIKVKFREDLSGVSIKQGNFSN